MEYNRLHRARLAAEAGGGVIDLVDSNFGRAGFGVPEWLLDRAYRRWRERPGYTPSALGLERTRRAVADWYASNGVALKADGVLLTAGSTMSYHLLFRTLCDKGPPALPRPAYPLFEEIARINGITPLSYRLSRERRWRVDRESIETVIGRGAGCVVLVTPNNPCGTHIECEDLEWICRVAGGAGIPIVSDEVFATFVTESSHRPGARSSPSSTPRARSETSPRRAPSALDAAVAAGAEVYVIDGLSKCAAAPEIKLGWMATSRPDGDVWEALQLAHDAYLSTSAFAEHAGEVILTDGRAYLREVAAEVARRRAAFLDAMEEVPGVSLYGPSSGIHAVIRIERQRAQATFGTDDDELIAVKLVESQGVYVHPGYLYGMVEKDPHFVVAYLGLAEHVKDGIDRIGDALAGTP